MNGTTNGTKTKSGSGGGASIGSILTDSFLSALRGLAVSACVCLVLLLIGTAVVYSNPDPDTLVYPASLVILYLSAFSCGFAAVGGSRSNVLLRGVIAGVMLLFLQFALSQGVKLPEQESGGFALSLGLHALVVAVSAVGAYAGSYRKSGSGRGKKPKKKQSPRGGRR